MSRASSRVLSRSMFGLFAVLPAAWAHAVDRCEAPRGGLIPLPYSACLPDKKHCFNWMNAKCVDGGICTCKPDQCVMKGQCVDRGECPSVTGGTCTVSKCDSWRNATCSEKSLSQHEAHCLCGPGACPVKGECRPPGDCAKATDGQCFVLGCNAWRRATCSVQGVAGANEVAKCMCGPGDCPINGECVPKGGCPRYTGSSCTLFRTTGLGACAAGLCSEDAYCECEPGKCYVNGQCVEQTLANVELSVALGKAAEQAKEQQQGSTAAPVAAAVFAGIVAMTVTSMVALTKLMRPRTATHSEEGYTNMEGC